jgi:hypothetical protein
MTERDLGKHHIDEATCGPVSRQALLEASDDLSV